jgi:hypothetical protein
MCKRAECRAASSVVATPAALDLLIVIVSSSGRLLQQEQLLAGFASASTVGRDCGYTLRFFWFAVWRGARAEKAVESSSCTVCL